MKHTLLICTGVLALALNAPAADDDKPLAEGGRKARTSTVQTNSGSQTRAAVRNSAHADTRRNASVRQSHQTTVNATARNTAVRENNWRSNRVNADRAVRERNNTSVTREANVRGERNFRNGNNVVATNRERNVVVNRERNINRRNVTIVNNWRGERFNARPYVAFRNYQRTWHDRGWWRSHYNRIIFVSGGWYFWNSGYWYPAWGYDPGYYYPYDGPIYGYGDLTPDRVIVNVQVQLQRDGYYFGAVDGVLGPQTREAIAAFQADHGLAVTSAIDEPTLSTLGLV